MGKIDSVVLLINVKTSSGAGTIQVNVSHSMEVVHRTYAYSLVS